MCNAEKAIDRLKQTINSNQQETRSNLDKLFRYLARLEVAIGKINIQLEEMEKRREEKFKVTVDEINTR